MTDSHPQVALIIQGRKLDVSQKVGIVNGVGAGIIQATPRLNSAMEPGLPRSGETDSLSITDKKDVVELILEDNLVLYTSVQRLHEEIILTARRGTTEEELHLPARLSFTNQRTRGEDGLLIKSLKVLDVRGKLLEEAAEKGGEFAVRKIAEKIEEQLVGPDILYKIITDNTSGKEATLEPAARKDIDTASPTLLFIHGTAFNTQGSFSEL